MSKNYENMSLEELLIVQKANRPNLSYWKKRLDKAKEELMKYEEIDEKIAECIDSFNKIKLPGV